MAVLIEGGEPLEAKKTQWGVSLTSANPEPGDYYLCNSKEHAVKLFKALQERDNWMETAQQYATNVDYWRGRVEELEGAVRRAMSELGVPGDGYPAPVANAYRILEEALGGREAGTPEPSADAQSGEPGR